MLTLKRQIKKSIREEVGAMVVVMLKEAREEEIDAVIKRVKDAGLQAHVSRGIEQTLIGVIGDKRNYPEVLGLEVMPGVEKIVPILQPFKLASRTFKQEDSLVKTGNLVIGGDTLHVMAGPCAVESREQLLETAWKVKEAGATILRGGAFKPRTSPYSFQGLEEKGLKLLAEAREATGLKIITEVMDTRAVEVVKEYADIIQIGARNMQNFVLLKEVSSVDKPVLLKRGLSATIEEWLMAAEYIMAGGNDDVIMCERGIRSFETYTRNTLDLCAIPVIKHLSHLPVIVDPSHGIGKWRFVPSMARAAIAAGADGLLIEVHTNPETAWCDGPQSLNPVKFAAMMADLRNIAKVMGKNL
jgi:3-deoxy-7-phosphoheptulonate synthase